MLLKAESLLEAKNSTSRRTAGLDSNLISQLRQQGSGFNLEEVIWKLRGASPGGGQRFPSEWDVHISVWHFCQRTRRNKILKCDGGILVLLLHSHTCHRSALLSPIWIQNSLVGWILLWVESPQFQSSASPDWAEEVWTETLESQHQLEEVLWDQRWETVQELLAFCGRNPYHLFPVVRWVLRWKTRSETEARFLRRSVYHMLLTSLSKFAWTFKEIW